MNDEQLYGQKVAQFRANQLLLDRFQLHGILGRSPISLNWLATEKRLQRFVALKFIPEPIRRFPEHLEDLDKACRQVRHLKHNNIASVYEFIVTHDWAAFSVEAIDGETLADIVIKEPYGVFDIAKLSSYITETCLALHYLHSQNIVHDDIKPSNIMRVAEGGYIKVTDFHISRAVNNAAANVVRRLANPDTLPQNDFILRHGTSDALKFMSPQRAYGLEPTPLDDIYSLGATIYFLLTGTMPYKLEYILNPIESVTPPKMSLKLRENGIRNRFIPASWDSTIAACLEKQSQNRPQSILEFAHELDLDLGIPYTPSADKKARREKAVESDIAKPVEITSKEPSKSAQPSSSSLLQSEKPQPVGSDQPDLPIADTAASDSKEKTNSGESAINKTRPDSSYSPPSSSANPTTPAYPKTTIPEHKPSPSEVHQPNFSRGPRTATSASPPIPATPPSHASKADPFAPPSSSTSSTRAGAQSSTHATPPRPSAQVPPSSGAFAGDQDMPAYSVPYSSPFREEGEPSSATEFYQGETGDQTKQQQHQDGPLPYEEIDERDFRTSSQTRKSQHRADPTHQRSRYAQRNRGHSQQQSSHFNPPPPYAYQAKSEPSDAAAASAKKKSKLQKNLITILIALLVFYTSLFLIGFSLYKLNIITTAHLDSIRGFLFKEILPKPKHTVDSSAPTPSTQTDSSPAPSPSVDQLSQTPDMSQTEPPPPVATPLDESGVVSPSPAPQEAAPALTDNGITLPSDTTLGATLPSSITGPTKTVPDEYIQIQAAIDAAVAGETIRIKSGVYTENIIFKEGVRIIGDGMDVVTIQCPPVSPVLDIRNISSGHIEGVSFMHTEKGSAENSPPLINISNSNVDIIRCRILNSSGTGVQILNGSRATLRQNIIENNALFGISVLDSGTAPIIEANQINNNQRVGLVFSNGASGTARSNIIKENAWDGIAVLNPATAPTLEQNISLENQRRGIFFAKGAGGKAEGNTAERNKMNGISVLDEGTAPVISNNRISYNELRGIHFGKGAKGIAQGNISEFNRDIGILIADEGTAPELYNNTSRNNEGWGIAIVSGAKPPPSSGNIARDNKQGQMNFEQTR